MFIRALRLRTLAVGLESRKLGHRIGVVGVCREVGGRGGGGVGGEGEAGGLGGKGRGGGRKKKQGTITSLILLSVSFLFFFARKS